MLASAPIVVGEDVAAWVCIGCDVERDAEVVQRRSVMKEGVQPVSSKAVAAMLFGLVAIVLALAALTIVPTADMARFTDAIDLATLVIGFFLTLYGSAIVGELTIKGLAAGSNLRATDVAIAAAPAATGALLMIASSI
jgi:hypothetical protein